MLGEQRLLLLAPWSPQGRNSIITKVLRYQENRARKVVSANLISRTINFLAGLSQWLG
jgi:hypothetical protein